MAERCPGAFRLGERDSQRRLLVVAVAEDDLLGRAHLPGQPREDGGHEATLQVTGLLRRRAHFLECGPELLAVDLEDLPARSNSSFARRQPFVQAYDQGLSVDDPDIETRNRH